MTYHTAPASPGYIGVFSHDAELSASEQAARMNQLEADNAKWRSLCDDAARGMVNASRDVEAKDAEIQALRLQLASADEHVGALTKAIDELDSLGEWIWSEADEKTLLSIHLTEPHHTELTDLMLAARAWLRRGAE